MFKIVKARYKTGKIYQIRLFDIPVLQYEQTFEKNLKKVTFPFLRKPKKDKPVFYLKVNSKNYNYSIYCISHWINIVNSYGADFYILCDNKDIEYQILKRIEFPVENIKFIRSNRKKYKKIIKNTCTPAWEKAGYAHLTTYSHAQKHNIKEIWNIDSDDTLMCMEPAKASECLKNIANYAKEKNIDAFSLDFYYSRGAGPFNHWSFGVTHIINNKKLDYLLSQAHSKWFEMFNGIKPQNFDWYMNYIKETLKDYKMGVYCINNLLFLHDTAFFSAGWLSFMQYKNDVIEYPIFKKFYELEDIGFGYVPLHKDIIKFDFNVGESDGFDFLYKKFVNKDVHFTFVHALKNTKIMCEQT